MWPLKSNIIWLSLKFHITISFFHLRPLRGHLAIDLILLQKHGFFFKMHKNSSSLQKFPFFCHITLLCILRMGWILLKSSERKISLGDPVVYFNSLTRRLQSEMPLQFSSDFCKIWFYRIGKKLKKKLLL